MAEARTVLADVLSIGGGVGADTLDLVYAHTSGATLKKWQVPFDMIVVRMKKSGSNEVIVSRNGRTSVPSATSDTLEMGGSGGGLIAYLEGIVQSIWLGRARLNEGEIIYFNSAIGQTFSMTVERVSRA
jgi:hypothetical protein